MKNKINIVLITICSVTSVDAGSPYFSIIARRQIRYSQPTQMVFESQPIAQYFVVQGEQQYHQTLNYVRDRQHIVFWRKTGCGPCDVQHDELRKYQAENPAVAVIEVDALTIPLEVRRHRYGISFFPATRFSNGAGISRLVPLAELRKIIRTPAATQHQPVRRLDPVIARQQVFQPIRRAAAACAAGG